MSGAGGGEEVLFGGFLASKNVVILVSPDVAESLEERKVREGFWSDLSWLRVGVGVGL